MTGFESSRIGAGRPRGLGKELEVRARVVEDLEPVAAASSRADDQLLVAVAVEVTAGDVILDDLARDAVEEACANLDRPGGHAPKSRRGFGS